MRAKNRCGVVLAATALAATTAITGAGAAGADDMTLVVDGASALTVNRDDSGVVASYDNGSGRDLFCEVVFGNATLVEEFEAHLVSADHYTLRYEDDELVGVNAELPINPEFSEEYYAAIDAGEIGGGTFWADAGSSGPVTVNYSWHMELSAPIAEPSGLSLCATEDESYFEVESFYFGHGGDDGGGDDDGDDDDGGDDGDGQAPTGLIAQIIEMIDIFGSLG